VWGVVALADRPLILFATPAEFEAWIEANRDHEGIRVQLRKKSSTKPGMLYSEALDVALCHGWIDGQKGSIDDDYFFNGFSPRRARSPWSQVNREHVARLIEQGRMTPHGLAEVDRAKADGRWDAAYRQKDAEAPADLQLALDASPAASTAFAALNSQNRFAILFRIGNVRRAETRARKISEFVAMLERGDVLYP
jgi:uncharacterized protein YdeI (YjbR/CyaY-like superfamily)